MKTKQLVTLVIIVIIAGGLGLFMRHRQTAKWTKAATGDAGALVLPDLDVNAVAAIQIKDAEDQLTLQKSNDKWTVTEADGYPADFQKIRTLLLDLKKLTVAQAVSGAERFKDRLNLLEPTGKSIASGVLLQLKDQSGKPSHSIILGKNHRKEGPSNSPFGGHWPDGKYVRVKESGLIGLVTNTFSSVTTEKKRWLNRDFFKVEDATSVAVSQGGKVLWRLDKKDGKLTLAGDTPTGKVIDDSVLTSAGGALKYANFADIATGDTATFSPYKTCRIVDTDGIQYDVSFGAKKKDKFPVKIKVSYVGPEKRPPAADTAEQAAADTAEQAAADTAEQAAADTAEQAAADTAEQAAADTAKQAAAQTAKQADAAFAKKLAAAKEKVVTLDKRLSGWTYLINSYTLAPLDKARGDFFTDPPKAKPDTAKKPNPAN